MCKVDRFIIAWWDTPNIFPTTPHSILISTPFISSFVVSWSVNPTRKDKLIFFLCSIKRYHNFHVIKDKTAFSSTLIAHPHFIVACNTCQKLLSTVTDRHLVINVSRHLVKLIFLSVANKSQKCRAVRKSIASEIQDQQASHSGKKTTNSRNRR